MGEATSRTPVLDRVRRRWRHGRDQNRLIARYLRRHPWAWSWLFGPAVLFAAVVYLVAGALGQHDLAGPLCGGVGAAGGSWFAASVATRARREESD